jgi:hypothetical protein
MAPLTPENLINPIVFYHAPCQDGIVCAYIAQKYFCNNRIEFAMYGLTTTIKNYHLTIAKIKPFYFLTLRHVMKLLHY